MTQRIRLRDLAVTRPAFHIAVRAMAEEHEVGEPEYAPFRPLGVRRRMAAQALRGLGQPGLIGLCRACVTARAGELKRRVGLVRKGPSPRGC